MVAPWRSHDPARLVLLQFKLDVRGHADQGARYVRRPPVAGDKRPRLDLLD